MKKPVFIFLIMTAALVSVFADDGGSYHPEDWTYGNIYVKEPNDKIALERLAQQLPNHKIIGVDSLVFVRQNGSLHCSSQNRFLGARSESEI